MNRSPADIPRTPPSSSLLDKRAKRLGASLSGTNLERAGDYNRRIVLQAIRMSPAVTRPALAEMTGLTTPAIANITHRLLEEGLIRDSGRQRGHRGQPAIRVEINPDGCFALGLNIDRDHITLLVLDLAGRVRARESRNVAFAWPEEAVAWVGESLEPLLSRCGVARDRILGVGIAFPEDIGRVASFQREPPGWTDVDLRVLFRDVLPWHQYFDNDAAAASLGEMQCGMGLGLPSFFYAFVGAGLGGGLVVDRNYFRGASGRSGKVGLMPQFWDDAAGKTVQDTVSLSAIFARLKDVGIVAQSSDILASDDPRVRLVIEQWQDDAVRVLTKAFAAVACILDPHAIIIGGRLPRAVAEALVSRLNVSLAAENIPAHPPVLLAEMAEDAAAVGAAILPFLDRVLPSDSILMQAGRGTEVPASFSKG